MVSKELKRVFFFPPFSLRVFHRRVPSENVAKQRRPGDWVRMGDREHGAKGLCQERALVSGLEVGVFGGIQTWRETWDPNLEDGEDGWDDGFFFSH